MTYKVKSKWINGRWMPVGDAGQPLQKFSNFRLVGESDPDKDKRAAFTQRTKDSTATLEGEVD